MICMGEAPDRSYILDDQKWINKATGETEANKLSIGLIISERLTKFLRSI